VPGRGFFHKPKRQGNLKVRGSPWRKVAGDERIKRRETRRSCLPSARWPHGGRRPENQATGIMAEMAGDRQQRCGTGSTVRAGHRAHLAVSGPGCKERLQRGACDGSQRRLRRRLPGGTGFPIPGQRARWPRRMTHSGPRCDTGFTGSITASSSSAQGSRR
jgi:hypothetical protein